MANNSIKYKNILFIVTKSENGGAQRWVKEQIDILDESFKTFIVTDEEGWLIKHAKCDDFMTDKRILSPFSHSFLKRFANYVKDNDIDLIVSGTANAGVYGRLVKLYCDVNVLYVSHGWSSIYNGGVLKTIYTTVERLLSTITESVLCVSSSDFTRAKEEIKIEPSKLKFIVNKSLPMKRREPNRAKEDKIKIVNVARFKHPKRHDLLIEAMRDIDAELYLVGDGPTREELQKNAPSNVYFLGEVDGFDQFCRYDIFALISDSEGLPLSAVEAMGVGLPLVLSNVGGCPELIGDNGVLVQNEVESIKSGIINAIKNIQNYSARSVEMFDREYNLEKFKDLYIDYYSSYMEKSKEVIVEDKKHY